MDFHQIWSHWTEQTCSKCVLIERDLECVTICLDSLHHDNSSSVSAKDFSNDDNTSSFENVNKNVAKMCVFVFVGECFHVKLVWAKWFGYIIYQDQLEKLNLLEKLYKTMEILAEWLLLCLIISVSLVRYSLSQA